MELISDRITETDTCIYLSVFQEITGDIPIGLPVSRRKHFSFAKDGKIMAVLEAMPSFADEEDTPSLVWQICGLAVRPEVAESDTGSRFLSKVASELQSEYGCPVCLRCSDCVSERLMREGTWRRCRDGRLAYLFQYSEATYSQGVISLKELADSIEQDIYQ